MFEEKVDLIQVGARNMQNFDLLRQLGQTRKPVLLKRGQSATIEEWLMSAEYIMAGGNRRDPVRARHPHLRNLYPHTVELGAIPAVKKLIPPPVIVDPSHGTGKWWMVELMARAAVAVGADGVMIEVHNDPVHALCDGQQSIKPDVFASVIKTPEIAELLEEKCNGRTFRAARDQRARPLDGAKGPLALWTPFLRTPCLGAPKRDS